MKSGKENRTIIILLLVTAFICWPVGFGSAYALVNRLSEEDLRLFAGAVYFLLAFVVIVAGFSLVLYSYSFLRRREEAEDDKRELDMLKVALGRQGRVTIRNPLPASSAMVPMMPQGNVVDYRDIELE